MESCLFFFVWGGMYECVDVRGQFPPDRTWVKLILATSSSTYWAILLTPKYTDLSKFTHLKFWFNQAPNSLITATCGWLLAKSNRTSVEWPSAVSCHRIRLGTPALAKVVAFSDRGLAVKKKVQSAVPEARGSKGWQKALRSQWARKREAGLRSEVSASGVVCVSDKTMCLRLLRRAVDRCCLDEQGSSLMQFPFLPATHNSARHCPGSGSKNTTWRIKAL